MAYNYNTSATIKDNCSTASVPKEIGLLQRAEGIASGLASIENGLNDLMFRLLQGSMPPALGAKSNETPLGFPALFAKVEEHICACHQQLSKINGIL